MIALEPNQCPRCGGGIPNSVVPGAYPGALSRYDNLTEVCSQCGTDEAMSNFGFAPVVQRSEWYDRSEVKPS